MNYHVAVVVIRPMFDNDAYKWYNTLLFEKGSKV